MMERRDLVFGGLLTALPSAGDAELAQRDDSEVARAISRLRETLELRLDAPFAELREIRQQQRVFLKGNQKFPDFIEIGVNVWERLHDWHVRYQIAPNIVRRDDGRYTMTFMFTTLVLRPEMGDNYVGFAYDVR